MHDASPHSPRPAAAMRGDDREQRADPETRALLDALNRDPERLRLLGEGGPDWERLRARAFRVMVARPLQRAWAWCASRLCRRIRAARPPAYRAETAQEVRSRAE